MVGMMIEYIGDTVIVMFTWFDFSRAGLWRDTVLQLLNAVDETTLLVSPLPKGTKKIDQVEHLNEG